MSKPLKTFCLTFRFKDTHKQIRVAASNLSEAIRRGIKRARKEFGEPDQILSAKSL